MTAVNEDDDRDVDVDADGLIEYVLLTLFGDFVSNNYKHRMRVHVKSGQCVDMYTNSA